MHIVRKHIKKGWVAFAVATRVTLLKKTTDRAKRTPFHFSTRIVRLTCVVHICVRFHLNIVIHYFNPKI